MTAFVKWLQLQFKPYFIGVFEGSFSAIDGKVDLQSDYLN